jgi:4-hydroxy-tetrahydrodipicolinate synthase
MASSSRRSEVLAATPTLLNADGELDAGANKALLTGLAGRVDGVFLAGTTGEFPGLTLPERSQLLGIALDAFGPEGVVVHVGSAATRDAVALARDAVAAGARRLAVITPYYLAVDESEVTRHFAAVAEAAGTADGASVYAYLFPERTGVTVEPASFAAVAAEVGLAGAKLSGAAGAALPDYVAALPADAVLWAGADTTLPSVVRAGGRGVVAAVASAFPVPFAALADAVASGDAAAERAAQAEADAVKTALGGTIAGLKYALELMGVGTAAMRMPAPGLSAQDRERIERFVTGRDDRLG